MFRRPSPHSSFAPSAYSDELSQLNYFPTCPWPIALLVPFSPTLRPTAQPPSSLHSFSGDAGSRMPPLAPDIPDPAAASPTAPARSDRGITVKVCRCANLFQSDAQPLPGVSITGPAPEAGQHMETAPKDAGCDEGGTDRDGTLASTLSATDFLKFPALEAFGAFAHRVLRTPQEVDALPLADGALPNALHKKPHASCV